MNLEYNKNNISFINDIIGKSRIRKDKFNNNYIYNITTESKDFKYKIRLKSNNKKDIACNILNITTKAYNIENGVINSASITLENKKCINPVLKTNCSDILDYASGFYKTKKREFNHTKDLILNFNITESSIIFGFNYKIDESITLFNFNNEIYDEEIINCYLKIKALYSNISDDDSKNILILNDILTLQTIIISRLQPLLNSILTNYQELFSNAIYQDKGREYRI